MWTAELDVRYVVAVCIMMLTSLPLAVLVNYLPLRWFFIICFFSSFVICSKRKKGGEVETFHMTTAGKLYAQPPKGEEERQKE